VKARSEKIRMGKTEEGESKRESRKETGEKGKDTEAEESKDDRSKENSREVGNLEQRRGDSKIESGSKKTGARKVP